MTPLMSGNSSSVTTRILVIGGTGMIGRHLVTASLDAGHPTAVLVRPAAAAAEDPARASLLEAFETRGASLIYGDINDGEALVAAIRQAGDVVISAVGHSSPEEVESQLRIVAAIKQADNVKRFLPSEYGCDWAHVAEHTLLEPARSILGAKIRVRHALKAAGIPHTIVCSNWAQSFLLPRAGDPQADGPPDTTATIFGDGQVQAVFVNEDDMSRVAIKAVQDPRTLNKILHVCPLTNLCSLDQLVSLWEDKIGRPLHRHYVAEEELVKKVQEAPFPLNLQLAIVHATFIAAGRGLTTNNKTTTAEEDDDVRATQLYPGMSYVTVKGYLDALPPHFHI